MSAFQAEVVQPEKSAENPFFKSHYVPLPNVIKSITSIASKHGLSFMQIPVNGEKGIGVQTIVMHTSGEFIEGDPFFLPMDKQTPQAGGSCLTYARRYSLSAAFGLDSEIDDDGNHASEPNSKASALPPKRSTTPRKPVTPTIAPEDALLLAEKAVDDSKSIAELQKTETNIKKSINLTEEDKSYLDSLVRDKYLTFDPTE